jgi:hypothetical protein
MEDDMTSLLPMVRVHHEVAETRTSKKRKCKIKENAIPFQEDIRWH